MSTFWYIVIVGIIVGGFAGVRTGRLIFPLILIGIGGAFAGVILGGGPDPAVHAWPILTSGTVPILMAVIFVTVALFWTRGK